MTRLIHIISKHPKAKVLSFTFCFLFLISYLLPFTSFGQIATYPVQVSTNLLPPYSLYLSDYASGAREHVSVTLINRDVNRPGLQVRLRLTVKGQGFTVQTLPQAVFAPITIDPNIPYRLSQQELAPYFDPAALTAQGAGMQSYRNEGRLPEGMLQFCFDVMEYHTGRMISQQGCGTAWLTIQKPPLLSLPFNKENVTVRDPQNLLFQWTPRHSGLSGIEYELIIKQLYDNGMAPEAAFAYSPEIIRERTKNTSFLYGAMMPPLTPGYRYAWAVRAVASDGFAEQRVFENDGLSEIRVFSLEEYCPAVMGANAVWERGTAHVQWQLQAEHREYAVAYREKDGKGDWQYVRCENPPARITDMQPGKTYEYRVGSACGLSGNLVYGQMLTLAVPVKDTAYLANCGVAPEIDLSNKEPLENLSPGEEFMAYDFPVTVLTVSGGNGVFSGTGYTQMPGMFNFAKYKLRFNGITINSDRRMIAGQCESIADPNEGQIANLDDILGGGVLYGLVKDGITKADVELDFAIDELTEFTYDPATGTLTAATGDGETHEIPVPAAASDEMGGENVQPDTFKEFTVQDQEGNIYQVTQSADPQHPEQVAVTPVCKAGDALTADNFNPKKLDYEQAVITFRKGAGYYAFDTWQDAYEKAYLIRDKYENLYMIYRVPWKLLPAGKSDVIEATVEIKDESIDPAKVVFKTPKGVEFKSEYKDGVYTINLVGGIQGDGQEIYATYKSGNRFLNFGKLSVASYAEQTCKVAIVPVNETDMDIAAIRQTLKDIYGPVGIHWEVTEEKGYSYFGENKFFEKNSGLLNSYTEAMRAMNADFADNFKNGAIDQQTNYVFILKYSGGTMKRDAAGFMPRGGQFGYIFTKDFGSDDEILQTIAHELGHGKLLLKHTFDKDYGIAQSTTNNLMDYSKGETHLAKWQWDVLADPGIAQGVFDRDEDGMVIIEIFYVQKLLDFIKINVGLSEVTFKTKDYYTRIFDLESYVRIYTPVNIGNNEIKVFVDFKKANGILDLSLMNNLYKNIGLSIDLTDKFHTGFYVHFKSNDNKNLIELWTKTYDEYEALLNYLGFKISDKQGVEYFIQQYNNIIASANNDCNKLDIIFETIPNFILSQLSNESKWGSLISLLHCSKSSFGTNECLAIANLLNGITSDFLYKKINENKTIFRELIAEVPENLLSEYILAFSKVGLSQWKEDEISKAGYAYAHPFQIQGISEDVHLNWGEDYAQCYSIYNTNGKDFSVSTFELGREYTTFSKEYPIYIRRVRIDYKKYDFFSPITLSFIEGCDIIMPAFMAYEIIKRYAASSPAIQMLQLSTSVLLPELSFVKIRNLGKLFKIKNSTTASKIDELLIIELESLNKTTVVKTREFVQNNLQRLVDNTETIWAMPNATKRGQIFEEILALTEYTPTKGWTNIGQLRGGTEKLVDFFHNNGIIKQIKTTNTINPGSISSNINSYKKVIDAMDKVKKNGKFITSTGKSLKVVDAQLEIVVPKGFDVTKYRQALELYNPEILIKFTYK